MRGYQQRLILARIVEWFESRIDDGPIEMAISVLVPYAAYLTAEAIHASGVLAVVAAGLYLGRESSKFFLRASGFKPGRLGLAHLYFERVRICSDWPAVTFVLSGVRELGTGSSFCTASYSACS